MSKTLLTRVKNNSNEAVRLNISDGINVELSPGSEMKNVSITNFKEISGKVDADVDLVEVNRPSTNKILNS